MSREVRRPVWMRDTSREKEMQQTLIEAHFSFSFGLGSSQDCSGCYTENNLKGTEEKQAGTY